MSDTVQLVPSVPVVTRPAPVRPDHHIEPAKKSDAENKSSGEGGDHAHNGGMPARHLTISRHDKLGTFVYRSIEEDTGNVVWQYPAENMLRMSQHLQEMEEQTAQHQVDEKA